MFVNYKNGNYRVMLNLKDGTKIRYNNEDKLIPSRPESIDVKITNQCNHGCVFCHENSTPNGKVASLDAMKNFVSTIPAYTEIAVGGGNLMESFNHTEVFLNMLKKVKAIPSITIRQHDFMKYNSIIQEWKENNLIYGIGISLDNICDKEFINKVKQFPTAVVHVIAGMLTEQQYKAIAGHGLKILILGYKIKGRGEDFWLDEAEQIVQNMLDLEKHSPNFIKDFSTVAFDNLALEQLNVREHVSKDDWEKYYMGEDAQYTFYVDLVKEEFAKSSTSHHRIKISHEYYEDYSVTEMFNVIRGIEILKELLND